MMRRSFAKVMVAMLILASAGAALSACNTTEGAGKDMSGAGHAISNSAERNK
jgi:predicted small secreted protein